MKIRPRKCKQIGIEGQNLERGVGGIQNIGMDNYSLQIFGGQ